MAEPDAEHEKKRRKLDNARPGAAAQASAKEAASAVAKADEINIRIRAVSGTILQNTCVPSSFVGKSLLDHVLQQHPQNGTGIAKLIHKTAHIDEATPLAVQGVSDGSELTLVWVHISKEQQQAVVRKMQAGRVLSGADRDAWNSITDLDCFSYDQEHWQLNSLTFPSALQSLTFCYHFNQSLDNTALPGAPRPKKRPRKAR